MTLKESIKNALPASAWKVLRNARDGMGHLRAWPEATFHPWRRESVRNLGAYHNIHAGKRCFILGNGPSLAKTDLTRLKHEYTIGLNRIFLGFQEMGWLPSYFVSVNGLVIEQSAAEIQSLQMPKFIAWRGRKWLHPDDKTMFLHTTYTGPKFATDIRGRVWEGGTVTYVALQAAYYLGFSEVVLIGVDHNYVGTQGKPNETVVSQGDDPNHFHAGYFGKGFRWQLPDLENWNFAYTLAREAYKSDNRRVIDATIGGKLQVFPKVDYDSLFK